MEKRQRWRRRERAEQWECGWRVWLRSPPWRRTRSCGASSEEAGWERTGEDKEETAAGDLQTQQGTSCLLIKNNNIYLNIKENKFYV